MRSDGWWMGYFFHLFLSCHLSCYTVWDSKEISVCILGLNFKWGWYLVFTRLSTSFIILKLFYKFDTPEVKTWRETCFMGGWLTFRSGLYLPVCQCSLLMDFHFSTLHLATSWILPRLHHKGCILWLTGVLVYLRTVSPLNTDPCRMLPSYKLMATIAYCHATFWMPKPELQPQPFPTNQKEQTLS